MIAIMFPGHVARLVSLADRDISLADGKRVFSSGESVRFLFVVREGGVRMLRRHPDGAAVVVQRVQHGGLVAEASLFAQRYHCEALADGQTLLARIPKAAVLDLQRRDPLWLQAFAGHLATEVQRARARAELLSLKRVSDRLDAWFSLNPGEFPERGRWCEWAAELGVTPEALYRELSKRRAGVASRAGGGPTPANSGADRTGR
jgi:CRP-like cAMP-binding protein